MANSGGEEPLKTVRDLKNSLASLADLGVRGLPRSTMPLSKEEGLKKIREDLGECTRCRLSKGRTQIVFGTGNPQARLVFVGEGPGRDEDLQGEPFVGRAGQLLTKIIEAMGTKREEVYIANIIKCRPPDNRYPEPGEVETCSPFLIRQLKAIQPAVIVTLGNLAGQTLLGTKQGITQLRNRFHDWNGIPVMPTYHPAFLLRNPNMKRPVWEDMQKVMELLKVTVPIRTQ